MEKEKNVNLKSAYEKLEVISGDEELRRIAELKLKKILDENSMKNAATKRGLEQGKKEIAKKMLEKEIPIEEISELTGLTKEEIEKLK